MPNPRYWAVVAHPRLYNVEAALAETDEHVWTVKRSLVRSGDRLALWRGLKDGHRGIVGLAQVLSDPEMMISPPEYRRYWNVEPSPKPERRVHIRFVHPPQVPAWLDSPGGDMLRELTVSRGQGTVFRITSKQWRKLLGLVGGWKDVRPDSVSITPAEYDRILQSYDLIVQRKVRGEQHLLRKYLLRDSSEGTCALCGREFTIDLLVAAHIKQRSECTPRERADYKVNIIPMCKFGCDDLFERGYLSAAKGRWIANVPKLNAATPAVREYVMTLSGRACDKWPAARDYFEWHNRRHGLE